MTKSTGRHTAPRITATTQPCPTQHCPLLVTTLPASAHRDPVDDSAPRASGLRIPAPVDMPTRLYAELLARIDDPAPPHPDHPGSTFLPPPAPRSPERLPMACRTAPLMPTFQRTPVPDNPRRLPKPACRRPARARPDRLPHPAFFTAHLRTPTTQFGPLPRQTTRRFYASRFDPALTDMPSLCVAAHLCPTSQA